jgi:hypothetical protein
MTNAIRGATRILSGIAHADYAFALRTPESQQAFTELSDFLLAHPGTG